ncbi:hypothetical protein GJ629_04350 [Halapricum sp. CBA1109]|uniref:DUF7288 family protein n=1 Tax=Halapricum sp. CBA1109 TaxID=2668068 RepID=UPI0012F7118E|nr:hypothetical protein [Halapricum sp. CBA1109]MUV89222.1 hypothetical protein [Halapricum sp. CBA1109]
MGRGQAYTLEGFIAALIVASSVLVGLQAVDTTPWTASGDDIGAEGRQVEAQDLLAVAAERGALDTAVRCVDGSGQPYPRIASEPIDGVENTTAFGPMLNGSFATRGFDYRVSFSYLDGAGGRATTVVEGEDAVTDGQVVTASRTVVLTDSMASYERDGATGACVPRGETLSADSDHYVPDARSGPVYNVVEVRVEVWAEGSN